MAERDDLLASIAAKTADYREGDHPAPTPDHVGRWISQFDAAVRLPMLREVDFVLQRTYFSKQEIENELADHVRVIGDGGNDLDDADAIAFWRGTEILNIQQRGRSQADINEIFAGALYERFGLGLADCQGGDRRFVYFDDILFSGDRIQNDLAAWLADGAPIEGHVSIILLIAHSLGKWETERNLKQAIERSGKKITFDIQEQIVLENRKRYRNDADVLWPTELPDDDIVQEYAAAQRFPFEPRAPLPNPHTNIFSSEAGRQLLEREFLLAGLKIISFSRNPAQRVRPLGYGRYGLGFGSTLVTYRNCPNNAPLALWWGDPNAAPGHPFRRWYPLLPRRTYEQGVVAHDFDF